MSRGAISVLTAFTAAGLGLAGAAAILGTLSKAPPGPSGRARPARASKERPPPHSAVHHDSPEASAESMGALHTAQAGDAAASEPEGSDPEQGVAPECVREIRGFILGPDDEIVPGAVLTGVPRLTDPGTMGPLTVTSGPDGSFVWELSRRTEFRGPCAIDAEGYASTAFWLDDSQSSFEAVTGITSGAVIRMRHGLSILGAVRYPDGEAASGVTVFSTDIRPAFPEAVPTWTGATTDADGRYLLTGLLPETVEELFVRDNRSVTGPFELPEGSASLRRVHLDLTIPRPRQVRVHVVLRGGRESPFVRVDHQQAPGEGGNASFWCGVGWHVLVLSGEARMGETRFSIPADSDPFLLEVDLDAFEWNLHFPQDPPPPDTGTPEDP